MSEGSEGKRGGEGPGGWKLRVEEKRKWMEIMFGSVEEGRVSSEGSYGVCGASGGKGKGERGQGKGKGKVC